MRGTENLGCDRRRERSDAENARKLLSLAAAPGLKRSATDAEWIISDAIELVQFFGRFILIGAFELWMIYTFDTEQRCRFMINFIAYTLFSLI